MKKWLAVVGILAFLAPLSISAQKHFCGLSSAEDDILFNNMIELRARHPHVVQPRAVVYVPIWFHLTANNDGTGRISEAKVLDMLCEVNRLYSVNNTNMQFYIKGWNYVNNSTIHNSPKSFAAEEPTQSQRRNTGMNIFLCATADDGTNPNAVTLAYYSPANDWIVYNNSFVSAGSAATMAHEIGHFFSLPHTFRGWDCEPYCASVAGACAPTTVFCNGVTHTVEKVARSGAGSNCATAGDGFCDTPADYCMALSGEASCKYSAANCNYVGLARDPDCVLLDPDETLLMGYFLSCFNKFSPQQLTAMTNNYTNAANRAYIRSQNVAPTSTTPLVAPTLIAPAVGSTSTFFDNITLDWSDVPNATGYIVEVASVLTFTNAFSRITTTSALQLKKSNTPTGFLTSGRNIYWRVRPYSNYSGCSTQNGASVVSARGQFSTSAVSGVKELEGVNHISVSPNPLSKSQALTVSMQSDKSFEATVKMYNVAGQLVQSENRTFDAGISYSTFNISTLSNGFYILSIESERGVLTQKFSVKN